MSGKNLLIPQGSKLLAKYSSAISFGQNRVQVAWQRLIRPDGVSLQMGNMNGVDPQGASGYAGYVDEHWWEYAKGIGLMLLFSIIDGQIQYSMKEANTQGCNRRCQLVNGRARSSGKPVHLERHEHPTHDHCEARLESPSVRECRSHHAPCKSKSGRKEIFNSKR